MSKTLLCAILTESQVAIPWFITDFSQQFLAIVHLQNGWEISTSLFHYQVAI
jgi:hypothetical protein